MRRLTSRRISCVRVLLALKPPAASGPCARSRPAVAALHALAHVSAGCVSVAAARRFRSMPTRRPALARSRSARGLSLAAIPATPSATPASRAGGRAQDAARSPRRRHSLRAPVRPAAHRGGGARMAASQMAAGLRLRVPMPVRLLCLIPVRRVSPGSRLTAAHRLRPARHALDARVR